MVNIEEGITYHREALSLRPPGHPDRSLSLISLADDGHMGDNSQPFHASSELYGGTHLNLLDLI